MYTTDRQILERMLIPALMSAVVLSMQKIMGDDGPVLDPVKALLGEALHEAAADIAPDRVNKAHAPRQADQRLRAAGHNRQGCGRPVPVECCTAKHQ